MSQFIIVNNVNTTLAANVTSPTATTITLASTTNLPTLSAGEIMAITLNDAATRQVYEICYVTGIAGAVLTVVRGQEGTTATTWLTGDYAYAAVTAGVFNSFTQFGTGVTPRYGLITGVTVGVPKAVSFSPAFPTNLLSLQCNVSTDANDLGAYSYHTDSETVNGFNVTVTGGPGPLNGVWFNALGD